VLVPIIVLRDHRKFNPLEPGHVFSLDVEKIKEQVQRLALPDQKIRIISGVHNLQVITLRAYIVSQLQRTFSMLRARLQDG
jgi:hypothetical protein